MPQKLAERNPNQRAEHTAKLIIAYLGKRRRFKLLTVYKLAALTGINRFTCTRALKSQTSLTLARYIALCEALDVPPASLLQSIMTEMKKTTGG